MARYTGPKFKIDRREGTNLFLKGKRSFGPKHPIEKKGAVPPGMKSKRSFRRRPSDYSLQLREKQKVKRMYGLLEKQFRKYFKEAEKKKGETILALFQRLETRLDNVIYRLGLAISRSQARQLVTHGHVLVNDKKVNIPSFEVKIGDLMSLKEKAQKFALVKEATDFTDKDSVPKWLDRKGLYGKAVRLPNREEVGAGVDESLIVEFYSR